jgi:hypothetical protein
MSDYTIDDLTAIRKAINSGSLKVRHRDREVTYRSLEEMQRIEQRIAAALGLSGPRRNYPKYSSGL